MARSLIQISSKRCLWARPPGQDKISDKRSLGKISFWDLCTSSVKKSCLGKIYVRDLLARSSISRISMAMTSGQDLDKRSLGKISVWDLCTSSVKKISMCNISATGLSMQSVSLQDLHVRWPGKTSVYKISVRDLLARLFKLEEISVTRVQACASLPRSKCRSRSLQETSC